MPRILIAYDTTEGQTRKIAERMAKALAGAGRETNVTELRKMPPRFSLEGFAGVLLGGSIHMSKHSRRLSDFVGRHKDGLNAIASGFFSVSLSAAGTDEERRQASRYVEEFLQQTGWAPTTKAAFAGGLLYREYGFLKRWMMKKIARDASKDTDTSRNHEYTDWEAVDQFARGFLSQVVD